MAKLYITHGFTGSGKSTFAKQFCNEHNVVKLSHDDFMIALFGNNPPSDKFPEMVKSVSNVLKLVVIEALQKNHDILLDIAGFERKTRDYWANIAKNNNAEFVIIHVKVSKEIALQRTLKRTESNQKNTFFINESGFNVINSRLEPLAVLVIEN